VQILDVRMCGLILLPESEFFTVKFIISKAFKKVTPFTEFLKEQYNYDDLKAGVMLAPGKKE
jgi:hypothetical protein